MGNCCSRDSSDHIPTPRNKPYSSFKTEDYKILLQEKKSLKKSANKESSRYYYNPWKNNLNITQENSLEIKNDTKIRLPPFVQIDKNPIEENEKVEEVAKSHQNTGDFYASFSLKNSFNQETGPVIENKQSLPISSIDDEERKELEKSKERILARFKEQQEKEKEKQSNEIEIDEDYQSRLRHRLTKSKKNQEKKLKESKTLNEEEENMPQNKKSIPLQDAIQEIDDFTRILLEKPVNAKKSRKFTRFNFKLDDTITNSNY